tara:strand:- start:131 stop:340 length:210 start_codon:yes stop_codon:yes gene_type:complete
MYNENKVNNENIDDIKLSLIYQDIEYIIIKDLMDVAYLRKVVKKKLPNEIEFELLMTKVSIAKQIREDF